MSIDPLRKASIHNHQYDGLIFSVPIRVSSNSRGLLEKLIRFYELRTNIRPRGQQEGADESSLMVELEVIQEGKDLTTFDRQLPLEGPGDSASPSNLWNRNESNEFQVLQIQRERGGVYLANLPGIGICTANLAEASIHIYVNKLPEGLSDWQFLFESPIWRILAAQGWLAIHAAAVQYRGKTLLLRGPSGAGKSCAALNLTLAGAQLISEEVVWIRSQQDELTNASDLALDSVRSRQDSDADSEHFAKRVNKNRTLTIWGVGDSIGISVRDLEIFPELASSLGDMDEVDATRSGHKKDSKLRLTLDQLNRVIADRVDELAEEGFEKADRTSSDMCGANARQGFDLDAIIFLSHTQPGSEVLRTLHKTEAERLYMDQLHAGERTQSESTIRLGLDELTAKPCYEMRYSSRSDQLASMDHLVDLLRSNPY